MRHPSEALTGSLPKPTRFVLDIGMRLVTQEHEAGDVAVLNLSFGMRGRDEKPGEQDFSHFVEQMGEP